ncbi:hypothetical protein GOBAR_AA24109 [Gossypium barbadense]|uniref:Uncharacterized protein n=1 Tax=Gossypium barbadense TaxID=3634 RepID=A0A2P5WZN6_GOSBA|nr:hypothetical protein GOBAR_AA24109 [Gossypium barbadense]
MSEESSEQPKKRGRPSHSPTDNRKTNKRITDKKARQEIRVRAFCFQDIVVELTKAGPTLKQLLEAFRSINGDDLLQTVSYILLGNILIHDNKSKALTSNQVGLKLL